MKKLLLLVFTVSFLFTQNTTAQLSKLKQNRDAAEEKAEAVSAENNEGWNTVSNPATVFDKYFFTVTDYAIEGITDKVQNALELNKVEQAFANSIWKFYNDGEFNLTNGLTKEYSFTVSGSTLTLDDGKTKSKAVFTTKNNLYKLRITEGNNKPVILVLEPTEKKGYDLYSKKELRKYAFTYLATNGDMYLLKQGPTYANQFEGRYIYTNVTANGMLEQFIHYGKRNGGEGELYYRTVPINSISVNGLEMVIRDVYSGVKVPINASYTFKHYTESNIEEKKSTEPLQFGDFSYDIKGAYSMLNEIAEILPADKKAAFAKGKAQRDALVAEQDAKEKIAWAKVQAAEAKKREKFATISFWNKKDVNCTIYDEGNAANGCMPTSYTFTKSRSKTITFCVGSSVRIGCSGSTFTVTKAMDGKSIDF